MKPVIRFSMKHTVAIFLMMALLVGGGIYSASGMKMEQYPDVDIPYLHVSIAYPNSSPQQVSADIGLPLEQALGNLDGVVNVYITAAPNALSATLQFGMTQDMAEAERLTRDAIARVRMPDGAREPSFYKEKLDADVYVVALSGGSSEAARQLAQQTLLPAFRSVRGVEQVDVGGVFDKKVYVQARPDALLAAGVALDQLKAALAGSNAALTVGDWKSADRTLPIRIDQSLQSVDDIKNIRLTVPGSGSSSAGAGAAARTATIGDVADVTYEARQTSYSRINGEPAVILSVSPRGGEDAVRIASDIKAIVAHAKLPDGMKTTVLLDRSVPIKQSVNSMLREVTLGALMAVAVTLLFLRNLRATVIAVISIPLSMFASLIVIGQLGYTLNMMTLSGIAVAIGRVVDDSIVVIENIFRRIRYARERNDALVEEATREVSAAITSSTITTVAVFLPLAFVPGIVGKFFVPLAWTIVISLLFSLLVAVSVVPLLSRLSLLRLRHRESRENALQRVYRRMLGRALARRWTTLLAAAALLALSVVLIAPRLGFNFLPSEKVQRYNIGVKMPIGTSLDKTETVARSIEAAIAKERAVTLVQSSVGSERAGIAFTVDNAEKDPYAVAKRIQTAVSTIPDADITVAGVGGVIGSSRVDIIVNGPNAADIRTAATQMVEALKPLPGLANVRSSAEGEKPEVAIRFDNRKLAEAGLNAAAVASGLRDLLSGSTVARLRVDNQPADIVLSLKGELPANLDALKQQRVNGPLGRTYTLGDLGTVSEVKSMLGISRLNGNEYLEVTGTITDTNTGKVNAAAVSALRKLTLPSGVTWTTQGSAKEMNEGFVNMGIALLISVFLVYLVMLIAFADWKTPLIILVAIPFSLVGALLGLLAVREPIGMPAMIGVLMLNGIVVTNAIVLLERVRTNRSRGLDTHDALMEAGATRVRPILMTAVATIGALIPLAVSTEAGLVSRALAVVVIGGLATSTFLTLIIVPVLYSLAFGRRQKAQPGIPAQAPATE
ncbi:efflux RND transporter permease subunit [Paenibacillus cymbidii]|uniref:efflux RND transporter permease subunit n=1 Tax=Paenibacillus cymbidii TaxID=1639034 RepID=UPI001080059B|nr:efflux RND transporter permease subunit [Paenibacillus cymbidii]